jgi:hypothetical protein
MDREKARREEGEGEGEMKEREKGGGGRKGVAGETGSFLREAGIQRLLISLCQRSQQHTHAPLECARIAPCIREGHVVVTG